MFAGSEDHRFDVAPLEAESEKLAGLLADAELFTREPVKFRKATEAMAARQTALEQAEEDWLALAEKAEG
jgi:ATP-binding cassette subfamily F protein uup